MIKLLAIAPEDGCGFYEEDGVTYSIRPSRWEPEEIPKEIAENSVASAIMKHGFWFSEKTFENLNQLILYLKLKVVETREKGFFTP